ncbi:sulfurtransferase [Marinomonas sp. C2222]|uniref:Sulfurtransferase n=1 Tax=Marinomonas sargassi TaxID=2984494 RepID=A0ABT2YNG7_9GAMM|nr:sulfurtransferase [Marinomonas sargassi]MCV2401433.1 sulfurtransferase [Marinomonas sargassi]
MKTLISAAELKELIGQESLVLLDSRFYLTDLSKGQKEYDKGHIPGAIFVDLHTELAGQETEKSGRHPLPTESDFAKQLQLWGITSSSQVVIYDDMGGAIAARAWWMIAQQGIDVRVLDGGYPAWLKEGFDTTVENSQYLASESKLDVSFPWSVEEKAVINNLDQRSFQLVDSRASDRFNGENETIDPIAGHIPGAINRPFADNLDRDGYFKPSEQLHVEWQDWLMSTGDDYVYYCGSGVTACHNVLALNYAGMSAKLVYVGSWSQWSKRLLKEAS